MLRPLLLCLLLLWTVFSQAQPASRTLSLNDAILLALRENPAVKKQQLEDINVKYALQLAQWAFKPHYKITASKVTSQYYSLTDSGMVTTNKTGITPNASLDTTFGAHIDLSAANNLTDHYNPSVSLQVTQHLMKGFGRPIVEAALQDAIESVKLNRLTKIDTLRTTVTNVINDYLNVISAQKTLEISYEALKRTQQSIEQLKLSIQAGTKPGIDLITNESDLATAQGEIESGKNALAQARARLLRTIGLDPNAPVVFSDLSISALIKKYHVPSLSETKKQALIYDIDYQKNQIIYEGSRKRDVVKAEDEGRWVLDLTVNAATGGGTGGGPNAGLNSLVNGVNRSDSATLDLTIPIGDQTTKVALEKAKIALHEAAMDLKEEKWTIESNAMDSWNDVFSKERSLKLSEQLRYFKQKTRDAEEQKYHYGLIDGVQLQTVQQNYVAQQRTVVTNQISYLQSLIKLDQLIGRTLQTWNIQVNYE